MITDLHKSLWQGVHLLCSNAVFSRAGIERVTELTEQHAVQGHSGY